MNPKYPCAILVMIVFGLFVSPVWAAGLWLYEQGTPDLGTASAGRASMAADASTAAANPAAMTRLDSSQMLAAARGSTSIFSLTPRIPVSVAVTGAMPGDSCRPAACTTCIASRII